MATLPSLVNKSTGDIGLCHGISFTGDLANRIVPLPIIAADGTPLCAYCVNYSYMHTKLCYYL